MEITSTVTESPNKAVIRYQWGSEKIVKAKNDTVIRYRGGIKSDILTDVAKGTELTLIEELDNWSQVATSDGFNGYVSKEDLTAPEEKKAEYDGSYKEEFTSLTRDHKINLAWHQVTSEAVSYTHLDVYKRQSHNSGDRVTGHAGCSHDGDKDLYQECYF